jgi:uncharacterized protein (DUF433 family)
MALRDIESQLLALSLADKARAFRLLLDSFRQADMSTELFDPSSWNTQQLIVNLCRLDQGIEKTPGICGGDACIASTRIPVWVLVQARNLGSSEAELLENYPTLTAADLTNAWTYAAAYPEEIAQAIHENDAA